MGRVNGPLLVAVAAAACLACVALVSLHTSHTVELEAASSAQTRWAAEQKDYARDHPVFTRCASKLDMPEFVKVARAPLATNHLVPALLLPPACIWRLLWPLRVFVFPGVLLLEIFPQMSTAGAERRVTSTFSSFPPHVFFAALSFRSSFPSLDSFRKR